MFTAWVNVRLATKVGLVSVFLFLFFFSAGLWFREKRQKSQRKQKWSRCSETLRPPGHQATTTNERERSFFGVSSVDVCSFD